jgi:AcrR family transcriptional regulator
MPADRRNTRRRLLEAGVRLFQVSSAKLLRGLTSGDVAAEAGLHRQTFYRYWETQSEFVGDLVGHVLAPRRNLLADGAEVQARYGANPDLEATARAVARHDFDRFTDDPIIDLRISLLAMQSVEDGPGSHLSQQHHDHVIDRLTHAYGELLEAWGRVPAPPLTTRDVARTAHALLVGLYLQHKGGDDDPSAARLYELVLGRLLLALTDEAGDELDLRYSTVHGMDRTAH